MIYSDNNKTHAHAAAVQVSDEALVLAVASGRLSGFEQIYERYAGQAYILSWYLVRNSEAAEKVIQEVFLEFWQHPHHFDDTKASFRTWLLSAVHHRALDEVRLRQSH